MLTPITVKAPHGAGRKRVWSKPGLDFPSTLPYQSHLHLYIRQPYVHVPLFGYQYSITTSLVKGTKGHIVSALD